VNDVPPNDRDIAMVFQSYALYPHMSVYENLAFALTLRKLAKSEIDARVRGAAAILGIDAILERRPKQLSGGQRQRVAIGRAIVRQPRVSCGNRVCFSSTSRSRTSTQSSVCRCGARSRGCAGN
jgi:multiple sugar transport system ATP-binding protein